MDKDFLEKLESVTEWKKLKENSRQAEYAVFSSNEEEGLIKIESDKGNFTYKLRPLNELFSQGNGMAVEINWKDEHYIQLLYTIERAIKKVYEENHYRLTDSDVILALETLAMKPEKVNNNSILKAINQELRLQLSMNDYSRHEVKMSIRKILNSAKRHNKQGGLRGYVNFILAYIQ
ncbi:MAG: hypothetical protein E3K37_12280 [Candidatus Kuenenia sp.]|nr:hypothetical protein [Candidatus Kuenenia hertensis]